MMKQNQVGEGGGEPHTMDTWQHKQKEELPTYCSKHKMNLAKRQRRTERCVSSGGGNEELQCVKSTGKPGEGKYSIKLGNLVQRN